MNKLTPHKLTSSGARQPRRAFLQQSVAGAVAATTVVGGRGAVVHAADRYGDLESDKYLGLVDVLAKIKDREVFTEGPAVDRRGRVFFTNVPMSKIFRWDAGARKLDVYRTNSRKANGLRFDPSGRLLACEGGAGRVTRTSIATFAPTTLHPTAR